MTGLELLELDTDTLEGVNEYFYERRWTDGLPIVPPTAERVSAMLAAFGEPGDTLLGTFPPRWRPATVEQVAVNAVMAGCRPEYVPVVVAGIRAILDPAFNLYGLQATTNPVGVMLVVHGPVARQLGVNGGFNLFGQGWRANATIGRAVRLCMINIGGGIPEVGDMSTLGNPNKYGSCIAENEAESPWPAYHAETGLDAGTSAVTAVASVAPQNVVVLSQEADAILGGIASAILVFGSNTVRHGSEIAIVIGPVHAKHLARQGYDKARIRQELWQRSRTTIDHLPRVDLYAARGWKKDAIRQEDGQEVMYATATPDDLKLFVAGGTVGPHSAILPTFNNTRLITRPL